MVIWRIRGDEIGPNGNGAAYYPTKAAACIGLREYREWSEDKSAGSEPEKITIRDRDDMIEALHDAMGYGTT
jgi:hypothetical protein